MSKNETGHIINVATFERLVESVAGCGTAYNPGRSEIQMASLTASLQSARDAIAAFNTALGDYDMAIASRKKIVVGIQAKITRMNAAIKSHICDEQQLEQIKQIIRKLRGTRASHKFSEEELQALAAAGQEIHQVSAAHTSVDKRADFLDQLIRVLETIPGYIPNEPELTVAGLRSFHQEFVSANNDVQKKFVALTIARKERNQILYAHITGLIDIASAVKAYVVAVFGPKDALVGKIRGLRFSRKYL
jgi:chromosome segregation ATPase